MENGPFIVGKSTISMVIFNSYVKLPEGNHYGAAWKNNNSFLGDHHFYEWIGLQETPIFIIFQGKIQGFR